MWIRVQKAGSPAMLVTWDGVYTYDQWREPENILWRGDQSNCLVWCNHTLRYMLAPTQTKINWEAGADGRAEGWNKAGKRAVGPEPRRTMAR